MTHARRAMLATALALPLALGGCSTIGGWFSSNSLDSITLTVGASLNVDPTLKKSTPVTVDFVYVTDSQLVATLTGLTATQWWAQKGDLVLANKTALTVESYEVSPTNPVPAIVLPDNSSDAVAIFVFAVYQGAGAHRARIEAFSSATIALGAKTFTVTGET